MIWRQTLQDSSRQIKIQDCLTAELLYLYAKLPSLFAVLKFYGLRKLEQAWKNYLSTLSSLHHHLHYISSHEGGGKRVVTALFG